VLVAYSRQRELRTHAYETFRHRRSECARESNRKLVANTHIICVFYIVDRKIRQSFIYQDTQQENGNRNRSVYLRYDMIQTGMVRTLMFREPNGYKIRHQVESKFHVERAKLTGQILLT